MNDTAEHRGWNMKKVGLRIAVCVVAMLIVVALHLNGVTAVAIGWVARGLFDDYYDSKAVTVLKGKGPDAN